MYEEYYINTWDNTSLTGGSPAAYVDTTVRLDSDADFKVYSRSFVGIDGRVLVRMTDDAEGRQLSNQAVDVRLIAGPTVDGGILANSFKPYILPVPHIIKAATTFTCSMADNSGVANSIRLAMHGGKVRSGDAPWDIRTPEQKKQGMPWVMAWRKTLPFDYFMAPTQYSPLPANATNGASIAMNIDAHFLVTSLTGFRTGPALITLSEQSTGRQWMNTAIHMSNLFGNANYPNILPVPRLMARGSVINVSVQDISGNDNTIGLNFSGIKLYSEV